MKPMTPKKFRAARMKLDLTQKELAAFTNSSARTIQAWESGKTPVSIWVSAAMNYFINNR